MEEKGNMFFRKHRLRPNHFLFLWLSLLFHALCIVLYLFLPRSSYRFNFARKEEKETSPILVELETPAELRPGFVKPTEEQEQKEATTIIPIEAPTLPFEEKISDEEEFEVEDEADVILPAHPIDYKKEALKNLFTTTKTKGEIKQTEVVNKRSLFIPQQEEKPLFDFSSTFQDMNASANGNSLVNRAGDPTKNPTLNDFKTACYSRRLFDCFLEELKQYFYAEVGNGISFNIEFDKNGKLLCLESGGPTSQKVLEAKIYKSLKSLFPIFPIPDHLGREWLRGTITILPTVISFSFR